MQHTLTNVPQRSEVNLRRMSAVGGKRTFGTRVMWPTELAIARIEVKLPLSPAGGPLMKAAVVIRFGSRWSIEIREVPKPSPARGEVLVRVHAATVNRTDCGELRHPVLQRMIVRRPQRTILGMDFAGEIEAVGDGVATLSPGDRVFGMCPYGRNGAQAEYFCMPESGAIATMPAETRFDEAPVCEGAYYANASVISFGLRAG